MALFPVARSWPISPRRSVRPANDGAGQPDFVIGSAAALECGLSPVVEPVIASDLTSLQHHGKFHTC